ncbi:uncharacterized protein LOC115673224 [Syzygium oleosum]|uniref:uncharacterized protein LOC115673224 n=1 Tax=Syzygium oleosum TaxID=219896 RepID=UPI0011D1AE91|nr:uncharacterized protein LOC115673224 [Syzygium oleosum]
MPPEPLPWDRKDFLKERKHERSESLGSVARWRDSSSSSSHHAGSRGFTRWGSADFRRPPGHGKQGGWHMFPEESGYGYVPSRSADKPLEDESGRRSGFRGDGKYSRSYRDNRGSFGQRDWKVSHSWETSNGSYTPGRPTENNSQRPADMLTQASSPHSDFSNLREYHQLHPKDHHDKSSDVKPIDAKTIDANGLASGQKSDNSVVALEWKPLKWSRSGSLTSRGSGLSHSSSSKSMGGVDSSETKVGISTKDVTSVPSPSQDAAACVTSAAPSEDMTSKKKPRLGWGEGLAKYEKKKVGGLDENASKNVVEPAHSLGVSVADKSPGLAAFSDCASPATPSSVACSSSPGTDDKSFLKGSHGDTDLNNLCQSPYPSSQDQQEGFSFNLETMDANSIANMGSSLVELLQLDDPSSMDSGFVRSTALNKLLLLRGDVLKALEMTELEIDSLETERKSLISQSGDHGPCTASSSSLAVETNAKPGEHDEISNVVSWPSPLEIFSSGNMDKGGLPLGDGRSEEIHAANNADVDSPGTATSEFAEPFRLLKGAVATDKVKEGERAEDMDTTQVAEVGRGELSLEISVEKTDASPSRDKTMVLFCEEDRANNSANMLINSEMLLPEFIVASNKETASKACEVFDSLLPRDQSSFDISRVADAASPEIDSLFINYFTMRKRALRFKERAVTLKFKAFHYIWKEDLHLLSLKKVRAKPQKKIESSLRVTLNGHQKNRSSIRSRVSSPVGNSSLVPSPHVLSHTSKLLSDSQMKSYRKYLKMPALIFDDREKTASRFISTNGLIEDPCVFEKERTMINPWTTEERDIFLDKLAIFGKDFSKIASFLDHKTTADCVEFYYKNHKSDTFERTMKKLDFGKRGKSLAANNYLVTSEKRWSREVNAVSLDVLGAASAMAAQQDEFMLERQGCAGGVFFNGFCNSRSSRADCGDLERSSSFNVLGSERETVAADVLAGICGSLSSEAMSSCVTSSVDPGEGSRELKCSKVDFVRKRPFTPEFMENVEETCSGESSGEMDASDWTDEEKSAFMQSVSSYGKDFVLISRFVGTRSVDQCRLFFSKARKCLGLDSLLPICRSRGTPVSEDANGDGDMEDACGLEITSAICGDKLSSKMDEDLLVKDVNQVESDCKSLNFRDDLNKSDGNTGSGELSCECVKDMEIVVPDFCQMRDGDEVVSEGVGSISASVGTQKSIADSDVTRVEVTGAVGASLVESASVREDTDGGYPFSASPDGKHTIRACTESFKNITWGQEALLPQKCNGDTTHRSSLLSSSGESDAKIDSSRLPADRSPCFGFSLNSESEHQVSLVLDPVEISCSNSRHDEKFQGATRSLSSDSAPNYGKNGRTQDRMSSTSDGPPNKEKHKQLVSNDEYYKHVSGSPLLSQMESSQILRGYPIQLHAQENSGSTSGEFSEVQKHSKPENSFTCRYVVPDFHLRKCTTSKSHSPVAELPLLPHKSEPIGLPKIDMPSLPPDSQKQSKSGDFKLFGQILSHPPSQPTPKLNVQDNDENGAPQRKLGSKETDVKPSSNHSEGGNSAMLKFDCNNYAGLENVPLRSYGFWDGNRIQISSLPDSALLLAKYPAAFSNFPLPATKLEQHTLQPVSKSSECSLNGVSVFPSREVTNGNGIVDYRLYRSRDDVKVQPFAIDVKQRQDACSELQRYNGFEAVSTSIQHQGRGMIAMNVVGRGGVRVGAPCNGVSDPVTAIKMQFAQSDPLVGHQNGNIVREEESWRGKGDLGR